MALTRRKRIAFAILTITLASVAMLLLLLGADLILHQRAERSAGLNRYGYRGPVVGAKQPGELRVVMLGGSTVFGYGVSWNESIPAHLETKLQQRLNRPVKVVNLGFNNEGAGAFVPNLEDFKYLDYDVIVLYEGYNDLPGDEGPNRSVYRRNSAVYRLTGYYPILPLYLDEKAMMLRHNNDLNAAYEDSRRNTSDTKAVVFKPGLAQRTSAAALDAVSTMTKALDGQLEKTGITPPPATKEHESQLGCKFPYVTYCESVAAAVRFALSHDKAVVVGAQPRSPGERSKALHTLQQEMVGQMIARVFGGEPRIVWADFSQLIDLTNTELTFDGMHLTPGGNAALATALVEPVVQAAASVSGR